MTRAQRINARQDKIWDEAMRLKRERQLTSDDSAISKGDKIPESELLEGLRLNANQRP